jgi:hypothetical protein
MDFLMNRSMTSGITSPCEAGKWSGTVVDDPGFCICCGADGPGVEADARQYECQPYGERGVYSAVRLVIPLNAEDH